MHNIEFTPEYIPDFELLELKSVCRICLHCTNNLSSLFNNGIESLISEFLPKLLNEISLESQQICIKCLEKAKIAYIFKKQCEYSDKLIKSSLKVTEIRETFEKQTQTDFINFMYPCGKCEIRCDSLGEPRKHSLKERYNIPNTCCEGEEEEFPKNEKNVSKITGVSLTRKKYKKYETRFSKKKNDFTEKNDVNHEVTKEIYCEPLQTPNTCREGEEKDFPKKYGTNFSKNDIITKPLEANEGFTEKYELSKENDCKPLQISNMCRESKEENFPKNEKNISKITGISLTSKKYKKYGTRFSKKSRIKNPLVGTQEANEVFTEKDDVNHEVTNENYCKPLQAPNKCRESKEENFPKNEKNVSKITDVLLTSKKYKRYGTRFSKKNSIKKPLVGTQEANEVFTEKDDVNHEVSKENYCKPIQIVDFSCKNCLVNFDFESNLKNHECPISSCENETEEHCNKNDKTNVNECNLKSEDSFISAWGEDSTGNYAENISSKLDINTIEDATNIARSMVEESLKKISLKKGKIAKNSDGKYECEICKKVYTRTSGYWQHQIVHSDNPKPYSCTKCSKSYSSPSNLKHHIIGFHSMLRPFKCLTCDRAFKKLSHRNFHSLNVCEKVPEMKNKKLNKRKRKIGDKNFSCEKCRRKFWTEKSLKNHIASQHDETSEFICKWCKQNFNGASEYKRHRKECKVRPVSKNKYLCSECGKGFTKLQNFESHKKVHSGRKRLKCKFCDKIVSQEYLSLHERAHTEGKVFHCTTCSKSYLTPYALKVHILTHTGELPHKCSYCPKSFLTNEKLQIHTRIHTGERPHKCSYCPRDFTQRTDLIAHHRRHTGERFHCDVCGDGFIQMYLLRRHKQKAHGINELSRSSLLESKKIILKN